jgi:hypothetical protein
MPMLLVDALEPAEAAALRAHLAGGCTRCASYLAEADAVLNYLPFALDPVTPPAGARDRLMDKVRQTAPAMAMAMAAAGASTYSTLHASRRRGAWYSMPVWMRRAVPTLAAACLVFAATVQGMLHLQHGQERVWQHQQAELQTVIQKAQSKNSELNREWKIAMVMYQSSKQISLEGRESMPKAFARAMWDEQRQSWHFRAFNMPPPPLSRESDKPVAYQLWFQTPFGRKVGSPKTFVPDEHGDVYIVVTLPKDVGPVNAAFVTDEPSVGTYQPTGKIHLYGKMD